MAAAGKDDRVTLPVDAPADGNDDAAMNSDVKLDASAQMLIGRQLKAVYGDILAEPVPEQFLQLLDDLERAEKRK